MKKTLLLLHFLALTVWAIGQAPGHNVINGNNVKTGMHSNGNLFFDEGFQFADFIVPYIPGQAEVATIFASGVWISGVTPVGDIGGAYVTYSNSNQAQFASGPVNGGSINVDFSRVWKVTKAEIESLIIDFSDGTVDNTPADNIMEWPGMGNPFYNGELPSNQEFAPFFDSNQDGIYNPMQGDYPIIGEDMMDVIPQEMLYAVFNGNHPNLSAPMDIDIHTLMYAIDCPQDPVLQNTIFTKHKVINSGNEPYNDFRYALWMDPDLGCHTDDYVGCDTTLNAFYVYNEDPIDGDNGTSCSGGIATYGNNPPVQSTVFLNQKMESFGTYENGALGTPPPGTISPQTPFEYRNYMLGKWRDGLPYTVGGSGYNPASNDVTNYLFPDDPNDPSGWSMYTANLPYGDRRVVTSTGAGVFQPGQILTVDLAHNFTQVSNLTNIETVTEAKINLQSLRTIYDNKFEGTCAIFSNTSEPHWDHITVFPNPSSGLFYVSQSEEFTSYLIMDKLGRLIKEGNLNPHKTEIVTDNLSGLYILKMKNKKTGTQLNRKLIIH